MTLLCNNMKDRSQTQNRLHAWSAIKQQMWLSWVFSFTFLQSCSLIGSLFFFFKTLLLILLSPAAVLWTISNNSRKLEPDSGIQTHPLLWSPWLSRCLTDVQNAARWPSYPYQRKREEKMHLNPKSYRQTCNTTTPIVFFLEEDDSEQVLQQSDV